MLSFHAKGVALAILAGIAAGLVSAGVSGHVGGGWVVVAVLVVFGIVMARGALRRRRTTYTISDRRLTIEVGLVGRDVHETRLEQIQNVNCRQSALERLLGIGTVCFDTAGGAAFDFAFEGVEDPRQIARTVDQALHERWLSRV